MEKKLATPIDQLCKGFPDELSKFLIYSRNLRFDEKPDYEYCKKLFLDCYSRHNFEMDYVYDWVI